MKLPNILAIDSSKQNEVKIDIELSSDLEAFDGHFPGNPILPGVVQIDWAVRFAAIHLRIVELSGNNFQAKFRDIIRPDTPLCLTLQFNHSKNQVSFTYMSGGNIMSSGQLKMAAKT